MIAINIANINI